jgi:hypothetical protein
MEQAQVQTPGVVVPAQLSEQKAEIALLRFHRLFVASCRGSIQVGKNLLGRLSVLADCSAKTPIVIGNCLMLLMVRLLEMLVKELVGKIQGPFPIRPKC